MKRRKLVIGLLWHSVNSDNFGVGALTLANIAIIRRAASRLGVEAEFVLIGWRDGRAPYVSGPDITMVPLRPREHVLHPERLAAVIRCCDVVFDIGYGDSFADLYGIKRFFYFLTTKAMVLACRRPLVLSPQTIGPFRRPWTRALAARVMKRAAAVVARDRLSYHYLRRMGVTRNCCESADVAFELPAQGPFLPASDKVRVGINVSGLLYNGGAETSQRLRLTLDYGALTERVTARFAQMPECETHLIGHVFADDPLEDDRRAISRLAARFPSVVVAPEFASPSAAKGYISAMDFFIGARMHACIAAFSSGVPVVPLAYSRKFSGLFGSLGYDRVAECTRDSIPAVMDLVATAFAQRHRLRGQVQAGVAVARERLGAYEDIVAAALKRALAEERTPARAPQAA